MPRADAVCPRCGGGLAAGARFCPACGLALARLTPGEVLDGKYEILDKIGEGGMGEVYRARHLHLDEIRIIKVTKPDSLGKQIDPRRFQEEARIATLVRHPNVAALYDFSRQPDGSYYMVWEFIDGVTLEERLRRRGPLPLPQALEVAQQVLAGLAEIHAQGIVHRDLSPDNIMLREAPGGRIQAKIIDLGIAKRVAAESVQMTNTGMFLGKLKYCSPEQAGSLPAGEAVDGRSDLYSFGVVLYEMLAGKPPFESPTPEGFIGKHLHTPAPPLDTTRLPGSAGPAVAAVVAKALEKRRERRYRDAGEFSRALTRVLPEAAEAARESSAPSARPRVPAAAGIALLVLLAAAGAFYALRGRSTGVARTTAPRRAAASSARPPATPVPAPQPTAVTTAGAAPPEPPPPAAEAERSATGSAVPAPPADRDAAPASPTPAEARRILDLWRKRPNDPRARRASEVAAMANRFVEAHPDDPLADEIRSSLPALLREGATTALDQAQPLIALLYFRAYRQLSFAPSAPDLEKRIEKLPPSASRSRRGPPGP